MAMIDEYMEHKSQAEEIDELKSKISSLKTELISAHDTASKYKEKWEALNRENTMLQNDQHRLLRQISQLKWETNNVIVSVPPSEQEGSSRKWLLQLRQAEQTKQNIAADIKNQILSNMEIMPADKRYDHFLTCCSIFGNVSVINKIIPELKNYLKESNKREKDGGKVQIDINGGNSSIFPNANNVNNYH